MWPISAGGPSSPSETILPVCKQSVRAPDGGIHNAVGSFSEFAVRFFWLPWQPFLDVVFADTFNQPAGENKLVAPDFRALQLTGLPVFVLQSHRRVPNSIGIVRIEFKHEVKPTSKHYGSFARPQRTTPIRNNDGRDSETTQGPLKFSRFDYPAQANVSSKIAAFHR
jgi:hypothetical protein